MELINTDINVGLGREIRVLQISDSHLCLADERETEAVREHVRNRNDMFSGYYKKEMELLFDRALAQRESFDITVYTGDIIDQPTAKNKDRLKAITETPFIYTPGNHDWCDYDVDFPSDEAWSKNTPALERITGKSLFYSETECKGVIFAAADNSRYRFRKRQTEMLKRTLAKGKPVVLAMHIPLYCPTLEEQTFQVWGDMITCGTPAERCNGRFKHCCGDIALSDETDEFIKTVKQNDRQIIAVIAGHLHFYHDDRLTDRLTQYVSETTFPERLRCYTIK